MSSHFTWSSRPRPSEQSWDTDDEFEEYSSDDDDREVRPALRLGPEQQQALGAAVLAGLREQGCDNTLRSAERWAASAGLAWPDLRERLQGNGGFCDCEVLLNTLPDPDPPDHELEPD